MSIVSTPARLGRSKLVDECLAEMALPSLTVQKSPSPDSEGGREADEGKNLLEPAVKLIEEVTGAMRLEKPLESFLCADAPSSTSKRLSAKRSRYGWLTVLAVLTFGGLGVGSERAYRQWLAPERPAVEDAAPTEAFCKCSKGPDGFAPGVVAVATLGDGIEGLSRALTLYERPAVEDAAPTEAFCKCSKGPDGFAPGVVAVATLGDGIEGLSRALTLYERPAVEDAAPTEAFCKCSKGPDGFAPGVVAVATLGDGIEGLSRALTLYERPAVEDAAPTEAFCKCSKGPDGFAPGVVAVATLGDGIEGLSRALTLYERPAVEGAAPTEAFCKCSEWSEGFTLGAAAAATLGDGFEDAFLAAFALSERPAVEVAPTVACINRTVRPDALSLDAGHVAVAETFDGVVKGMPDVPAVRERSVVEVAAQTKAIITNCWEGPDVVGRDGCSRAVVGEARPLDAVFAPEQLRETTVTGAEPTNSSFNGSARLDETLELDPDIVSGDTSLHGSHAAPTVELDVPVLVLDEYFGYAQGDGPQNRLEREWMYERSGLFQIIYNWVATFWIYNRGDYGAEFYEDIVVSGLTNEDGIHDSEAGPRTWRKNHPFICGVVACFYAAVGVVARSTKSVFGTRAANATAWALLQAPLFLAFLCGVASLLKLFERFHEVYPGWPKVVHWAVVACFIREISSCIIDALVPLFWVVVKAQLGQIEEEKGKRALDDFVLYLIEAVALVGGGLFVCALVDPSLWFVVTAACGFLLGVAPVISVLVAWLVGFDFKTALFIGATVGSGLPGVVLGSLLTSSIAIKAYTSAALVAAVLFPFLAELNPAVADLCAGNVRHALFILVGPTFLVQCGVVVVQSGLGAVLLGLMRFGAQILNTKAVESLACLVALLYELYLFSSDDGAADVPSSHAPRNAVEDALTGLELPAEDKGGRALEVILLHLIEYFALVVGLFVCALDNLSLWPVVTATRGFLLGVASVAWASHLQSIRESFQRIGRRILWKSLPVLERLCVTSTAWLISFICTACVVCLAVCLRVVDACPTIHDVDAGAALTQKWYSLWPLGMAPSSDGAIIHYLVARAAMKGVIITTLADLLEFAKNTFDGVTVSRDVADFLEDLEKKVGASGGASFNASSPRTSDEDDTCLTKIHGVAAEGRLPDADTACSSSSNAAPRVPNDVPGAFAFNTCTDACCGAHGLSLATLFWLIGVSITGKAVDYDTCPDGPEVGRSLLEGRLLGGGKKRKLKQKPAHCDICNRDFPNAGAKASHKCGLPAPIPAPTHLGFKPDPKICPICSNSGARKKDGFGTCSYWGESGHLGSDDVEQARAALYKKTHASRNEYYDQEKEQGLCGHKLSDERVDWESRSYGNPSKSKIAALRRWIEKTTDWRNDATFIPRLAAHLFDLSKLDDPQKARLEGIVAARCRGEVPRKADELPRADDCSIEYHHLAEVVETLLGRGDAGKLALLKLLLASKLLAALEPLMSGEMRKIFPDSRTNARGATCSKKLDHKMKKANCSGVFRLRKLVLELAGLRLPGEGENGFDGRGFARLWQCWGGFGLRTSQADLTRLTERLAYVCQMLTPEGGSRPGCDFGTLYALTQLFQGFAAKEEGDALAGDKWHRKINRDQSASMKEVVDYLLDSDEPLLDACAPWLFDLEIMLDLGRVVLFKNLDVSNLEATFATVFQFFTETYDSISEDKTAHSYKVRAYEAVHGRTAKEGCWEGIPTALDGFDIAYRIGGLVFGHDVFGEDPRDTACIAALARNLERLCKGGKWTPSHITTREWGGDSELREKLLTKLMPLADLASKIYHTVFWSRIVDAGDDIEAVLEAVREAWHEFSSFMENDYCRDGWLEDVEALFRKMHVPRLLTELAQPRQVLVKSHDLSNSNWREPVESTYVYADRPGYTFGGYPSFMREKAQTTPFDWPALSAALNTSNADASAGAGAALQTHNAKRDNPSTGAGGNAKRVRGGGL